MNYTDGHPQLSNKQLLALVVRLTAAVLISSLILSL
jgi:hypothetical protein